jgi:hypothetical protein
MSTTTTAFVEDLHPAAIAEDEDAAMVGMGGPETVLQELDIELEQKTKQMNQLVEQLIDNLESTVRIDILFKLPTCIQKMSMRDFCMVYGGDVEKAIKEATSSQLKLMPPPPALLAPSGKANVAPKPAPAPKPVVNNPRKRATEAAAMPGISATPGARQTRARMGTVASTPAGASTARGAVAATPAAGTTAVPYTPRFDCAPRPLQEGELAFTANGSPIAVPGTVKAKAGVGPRVGGVATITLGNGNELTLGLSELEVLKAQVKAAAGASVVPPFFGGARREAASGGSPALKSSSVLAAFAALAGARAATGGCTEPSERVAFLGPSLLPNFQ